MILSNKSVTFSSLLLVTVQISSFLGILIAGALNNVGFGKQSSGWVITHVSIYFIATAFDLICDHLAIFRANNHGHTPSFRSRGILTALSVQCGIFLSASVGFFLINRFLDFDIYTIVAVPLLGISLIINSLFFQRGYRYVLIIDGFVNLFAPICIMAGQMQILTALFGIAVAVKVLSFNRISKEKEFGEFPSILLNIKHVISIKSFGIARGSFPVYLLAALKSSGIVDDSQFYIAGVLIRIISAFSALVGNIFSIRYLERPEGMTALSFPIRIYYLYAISAAAVLSSSTLFPPIYTIALAFVALEIRYIIYAAHFRKAFLVTRTTFLFLSALLLFAGIKWSSTYSALAILTLADFMILHSGFVHGKRSIDN